MLLSKTFLSFVLLTLSVVDATPLVGRQTGRSTLRMAKRLSTGASPSTGGPSIPDIDRARVRALKRAALLGKRDTTSVMITNQGVNYVAEVGVGSPQANNFSLLIDTGSSNIWVGANPNNPYVRTSTSIDTGNRFNMTYSTGAAEGEEWLDTVILGSLTIANQSIGVADTTSGMNDVDGILGVGPADLTTGTVSNTDEVPTVVDNLFSQGDIKEEVLGVYFLPECESSSGELTFGGYDKGVITGFLQYVPLTTTFPSSAYWGVNLTVSYGGQDLLSNVAGVVDTGTTLITLATEAFQAYQKATGATYDNNVKLLTVNQMQYDNLQTLSFIIGGTSFELTPNAQIWPRSLNSAIGGDSNAIYLVVNDIGTKLGAGLDFTIGYTFLERFYTVYDTTNKRVGFATTAYTNSTVN